MNKITRRNERKTAQLEHTKKKLKDIKIKPKSGQLKYKKAQKKKLSLIKSLKNLKKRMLRKDEQRKELDNAFFEIDRIKEGE